MLTPLSRRHFLSAAAAAFLTTAVGIRSLPAMAGSVEASQDLNPHLYGGEMFAQEMLFEGLVTLGNDGSYHPAVAESWTISPDGRTYTFKIRSGITFSDGEKLDAYAVQANLR